MKINREKMLGKDILVLDSTIDFKTHKQKVNQYQGLTNFLLEKDLIYHLINLIYILIVLL